MTALGLCLGKLAPRFDPRTLRLASYMRDVPAPPPARDWASELPLELEDYRNREIGCCAIASQAHLQQTWSSQHGARRIPSERDVLDAYRAVSGWDGRPATDRGIDMLTALNHWRKVGIGGRKIRAFVKLDHDDWLQLRVALNLFGGLYVGASLPLSVRTPRSMWNVPLGEKLVGEHAVGSWGGHAMACVGYSRLGVTFITWGGMQLASWPWFLAYADEVYAAISDEWVSSEHAAPNGFDLDALNADLQEIA